MKMNDFFYTLVIQKYPPQNPSYAQSIDGY